MGDPEADSIRENLGARCSETRYLLEFVPFSSQKVVGLRPVQIFRSCFMHWQEESGIERFNLSHSSVKDLRQSGELDLVSSGR